MVGRWSDAYGRQPFLVMTFVCASFPVMVLFLNLHFGISMFFYFPAQVTPNVQHTLQALLFVV